MRNVFLTIIALVTVSVATARAEELTARQIVERAHAAAGGEAWLKAGTNVMRGDATLCRDGDPTKCVHANRYVMYRVYPTELAHGAHAGSGKFRLDAFDGDRRIFQVAFDGTRSYDQDGPLPPERAMSDEMSAFGFSAIRFALQPGFEVERLPTTRSRAAPVTSCASRTRRAPVPCSASTRSISTYYPRSGRPPRAGTCASTPSSTS